MNYSDTAQKRGKVVWIVVVALLLAVFLPMILHLHYGWNTLWHQATHHIAVYFWPIIIMAVMVCVLLWTGANLYRLRS